MIYESSYWKDDLIKQAKSLQKRITQKRWTDKSFARLEQTIMLGFYSIRKLIEAKKLSNLIVDQNLALIAYSWKGQSVTKMNWHNIEELYNLDNKQQIYKKVTFLCNQFVHSYIFIPSFNEDKYLDSIIVASDRERHRMIYLIQIQQIIDLFEQIGKDYTTEFQFTFNPKIKDYDVQLKAEELTFIDEDDELFKYLESVGKV